MPQAEDVKKLYVSVEWAGEETGLETESRDKAPSISWDTSREIGSAAFAPSLGADKSGSAPLTFGLVSDPGGEDAKCDDLGSVVLDMNEVRCQASPPLPRARPPPTPRARAHTPRALPCRPC